MFDIGFWELVLIGAVALMVLGPERLPKAASTLGRWVGQARSMARGLQTQMRQELEREEQKLGEQFGMTEKPRNESEQDDDRNDS